MKFEEHRHTIIPRTEPLPKEPPRPCMRSVIDIDLYNKTGKIEYLEPLTEFVPPEQEGDAKIMDSLVKRRLGVLNANKPSKERLEQHLRDGMSAAEIGHKYEAHKATVYNWIKAYGLKGIKGKAKDEVVQEPAPEEIPEEAPDVMVQESPTLAEIEQFHTDEPVQELPEVEMDEPLLGMTEEENMTDEEWEAQMKEAYSDDVVTTDSAPRETFDEIWQDVDSDLVTLERLYIADAKKSFRERLIDILVKRFGESVLEREENHIE